MEEEEAVMVVSVPGLEIKDMDLEAVVDLGLEAVVDLGLEAVVDMDLEVVVVMDLVVVVGDMGLEAVVDMEGVSAQGVTILEVDGVKMTLGSRVVGITHGREEVVVGVGMVGAGIKEEMMDGILVEVEVGT